MPAQPAWFHRLDTILRTLAALETDLLDRRAVERLFGVRPRRAQQLMAELADLIPVGQAVAVRRLDLAASLESLAAGEAVARARRRRSRIRDEVDKAEAEASLRSVRVPPPAGGSGARLEDLPPGIDLGPGRLEITFHSLDDLWWKLEELVSAAGRHRRDFIDRAQPRPEAG